MYHITIYSTVCWCNIPYIVLHSILSYSLLFEHNSRHTAPAFYDTIPDCDVLYCIMTCYVIQCLLYYPTICCNAACHATMHQTIPNHTTLCHAILFKLYSSGVAWYYIMTDYVMVSSCYIMRCAVVLNEFHSMSLCDDVLSRHMTCYFKCVVRSGMIFTRYHVLAY